MFAVQMLAISAALVVGVIGGAKVIESSLMREALNGEADLFLDRLAADPSASAPDTVNLTTYLASRGDIPNAFASLKAGFHPRYAGEDRILVLVRELPQNDRLVMRFEAGSDAMF